ncbi:MAG: hypothetical protein HY791_12270 [Deltaproteobacteria bacterium]|nr:hypothetical protein [Deltaproteobacteria bacterium]
MTVTPPDNNSPGPRAFRFGQPGHGLQEIRAAVEPHEIWILEFLRRKSTQPKMLCLVKQRRDHIEEQTSRRAQCTLNFWIRQLLPHQIERSLRERVQTHAIASDALDFHRSESGVAGGAMNTGLARVRPRSCVPTPILDGRLSGADCVEVTGQEPRPTNRRIQKSSPPVDHVARDLRGQEQLITKSIAQIPKATDKCVIIIVRETDDGDEIA